MDQIKNILILGLAVGCLILYLMQGCNDGAGVADAVKPKYIYDTTTKTVKVPVEKVVTRYTDRWKTDTVRLVQWVSDTVVRIDTVEIVRTFLEEHKQHVHEHKDSALKATITVDVYQNEVEGLALEYSILRPIAIVSKYDRFQLHVGGQ